MKRLASIAQISPSAETVGFADVFVVASGYEERAPHAALTLGVAARRRVCLGFTELGGHPQRTRNDSVFEQLGFEIERYSGDDHERVARHILRECESCESPHIVIDISSMTRAWYWAIIRKLLQHPARTVTLTFLYSIAEYEPPPKGHTPPRIVGPLPGVSTALEVPDRPIGLLMGLGYEADKAIGLMEYVEPLETYVFYADPAADDRFVASVKKVNREVLRRVEPDNVVRYRYDDLLLTFGKIESLLRGLERRLRVIATPLGPKPFGLVLYLASLAHPSVDVWRVSGGSGDAPGSRPPTGEVLGLRTEFVTEGLRAEERLAGEISSKHD